MMTLGQTAATFAGILILAAVVEGLVEYFARPIVGFIYAQFSWDKVVPDSMPALRYVSAAVGVGMCLVYNADLLALAGLESGVAWVGPLVTGLLVGRGANFVNDFASRWLVRPK